MACGLSSPTCCSSMDSRTWSRIRRSIPSSTSLSPIAPRNRLSRRPSICWSAEAGLSRSLHVKRDVHQPPAGVGLPRTVRFLQRLGAVHVPAVVGTVGDSHAGQLSVAVRSPGNLLADQARHKSARNLHVRADTGSAGGCGFLQGSGQHQRHNSRPAARSHEEHRAAPRAIAAPIRQALRSSILTGWDSCGRWRTARGSM